MKRVADVLVGAAPRLAAGDRRSRAAEVDHPGGALDAGRCGKVLKRNSQLRERLAGTAHAVAGDGEEVGNVAGHGRLMEREEGPSEQIVGQ